MLKIDELPQKDLQDVIAQLEGQPTAASIIGAIAQNLISNRLATESDSPTH
jgi:hypothetical protein